MIKFISEPDLLASIQATYNFSFEEKQIRPCEDDILNECITVPLLILDDVGKEQRRDMAFVQRILFRLIDGRYKTDRPMLLTTNKAAGELEDYLSAGTEDKASFSRLLEMCQGKFLKLTGEDYRRKIPSR